MSLPVSWYGSVLRDIRAGTLDLESLTLTATLHGIGYTPNSAQTTTSDLADELTGTGYSAKTLTSVDVTIDLPTGAPAVVKVSADPSTWTGLANPARWVVVRAGTRLLWWVDPGQLLQANGGDGSVRWSIIAIATVDPDASNATRLALADLKAAATLGNAGRVSTGFFMGWADQNTVNGGILASIELGASGKYPRRWGIDLDSGFRVNGPTVFAFPKHSTTITADLTSSATTTTLASATSFPATGAYWFGVIDEGTPLEEKILVKARSGTGLSSILRGVNGTTAKAHASGAAISCLPLLGEHATQGGIAIATCHPRNPGSPAGGSNPPAYSAGVNECDWDDLTTTGTATNTQWLSQLSDYADTLEAIETAGCIVEARFFHEDNNSLWLWSRKNPTVTSANYKLAVEQLHTYINETRGIHNILWVWGPYLRQSEPLGSLLPTYPGDQLYDLVGVSDYNGLTSGGAYPSAAANRLSIFAAAHPTLPIIWGELGPPGVSPNVQTVDMLPRLAYLKSAAGQIVVGFHHWNGSWDPRKQTNWQAFWGDPVMRGRDDDR